MSVGIKGHLSQLKVFYWLACLERIGCHEGQSAAAVAEATGVSISYLYGRLPLWSGAGYLRSVVSTASPGRPRFVYSIGSMGIARVNALSEDRKGSCRKSLAVHQTANEYVFPWQGRKFSVQWP